MKAILVGYGNVGKELQHVLSKQGILTDFIVRNTGIYDSSNLKVDEKENISKYLDDQSVVFISTPSQGNGEEVSNYYTNAFSKHCLVITCEKAFIANHWQLVNGHRGRIKYSATVGGDSGILNAISDYKEEILEIKAVINGTLNYISDKLSQGYGKGEVYKQVVESGFAEPGSKNFEEVIKTELQDVLYKTLILANHSQLYKEIISPKDVAIQPYKDNFRCAVVLNTQGIRSGFVELNDTSWFPQGVNNTLYINGRKIVEGLGAGGAITAERMFKDYRDLIG